VGRGGAEGGGRAAEGAGGVPGETADNRRPRKPRPPAPRVALYQPGDWLAVRLSDGSWGAALVLKPTNSAGRKAPVSPEVSLVGLLDYKQRTPPDLAVFTRRRWLKFKDDFRRGEKCVYNVIPQGHRKFKASIDVVGNIPLRKSDPAHGLNYTHWGFAEEMVRQSRRRR
jgi:hypothetical protein